MNFATRHCNYIKFWIILLKDKVLSWLRRKTLCTASLQPPNFITLSSGKQTTVECLSKILALDDCCTFYWIQSEHLREDLENIWCGLNKHWRPNTNINRTIFIVVKMFRFVYLLLWHWAITLSMIINYTFLLISH